jgi:hypothetical protein
MHVGGAVKVMACIDVQIAIKKILNHLQANQSNQVVLPVNQAPLLVLHCFVESIILKLIVAYL